MRVSDSDLQALHELRQLFAQMSDDEFDRLYTHICDDELGHPDEEYANFGFEGRLSCELFNEALICERDRRAAIIEVAQLAPPTNISVIVFPVEKNEDKILELQ